MLGGVLLGPEGEAWKKEPRELPESYEAWIDAQIFSQEASGRWMSFADLIYPLDKTQKKATLNSMWTRIKEVCSSRMRHDVPLIFWTELSEYMREDPGPALGHRRHPFH